MDEDVNVVSVSRAIPAPASRVFAVLTDTGRHPELDGSGMLRRTLDLRRLRAIGEEFAVAMHNEEMGDYEMTNRVVEYEPDRLITWEPSLSAASRDEDQGGVGHSAHQRWSYTLAADGDTSTVVTETFDCTRSPEWLKKAVRGGQRWVPAMTASLERLEAAVVSSEPA